MHDFLDNATDSRTHQKSMMIIELLFLSSFVMFHLVSILFTLFISTFHLFEDFIKVLVCSKNDSQ